MTTSLSVRLEVLIVYHACAEPLLAKDSSIRAFCFRNCQAEESECSQRRR